MRNGLCCYPKIVVTRSVRSPALLDGCRQYLGRAMEVAATHTLYDTPRHPYTQALLSAIPVPDPRVERAKTLQLLQGDLPSPINPPSGCVFRTRCPKAVAQCAQAVPGLRQVGEQTQSACIFD